MNRRELLKNGAKALLVASTGTLSAQEATKSQAPKTTTAKKNQLIILK